MPGKRAEITPDKLEAGRRMKAALDHARKTQRDVAEHLGISDATVSQWMTGFVTPRPHRMKGFALMVGASVDWLLCQDEMNRVLSDKLLRLFEAIGPDRLDFLDSLSAEDLRELVDQAELERARAARRKTPPTEPEA